MPLSIKARANKSAEILIYEDIGPSFWGDGLTAKSFAENLRALGELNSIDVRISSYGGDVFDGFTIYRLLADHPARKIVHVDGIAASIASVIAMCGQEIRISENGYIMIHNASAGVFGEAGDLRSVADRLDQVSATIADVYAARTAQPKQTWLEAMAVETWYDAPGALAAGLATEVAPNVQATAKFDPKRHNYKKCPAPLATACAAAQRNPINTGALARVQMQDAQLRLVKPIGRCA